MQIGVRVKKLREARNITQVELAEIVGVDNSLISRIEKGQTDSSPKTLHKIANALGVTVGDLLENRS